MTPASPGGPAPEGWIPGAVHLGGDRCRFSVWAPLHEEVRLRLLEPRERDVDLAHRGGGVFSMEVEGVEPGALYRLRLPGGLELPDPASRSQPRGVHGPSEVLPPDPAPPGDGFTPPPPSGMVTYEIHVGTFTGEGTFDAVIPRLPVLRELGVTCLELMPVSPFPGGRNWGYDGVFPYAVQCTYGGPAGLRRLVEACHREGIALILDVVYNHLGPEGCRLAEFGPYFTDRYKTPWGAALNFDGSGSDEVRRFFIESALHMMGHCGVDGFRVDAEHAIVDASARPFLQQLTETVRRRAEEDGRRVLIIAESDRNDSRVVRPPSQGGMGFDAQWADDFHHAVHALMTGERSGYYRDFGGVEPVVRALEAGYAYTGQHSAYRGRRHGNSTAGLEPERFVVCTQNHDQVGNRALGDRLAAGLDARDQRLLAALLLLSPFPPLLFMGQEYGETAPFPYFTSHTDEELAEAVRRGRRGEFEAFGWRHEEIPDPQAVETFRSARLRWELREDPAHRPLLDLHRELLGLRRKHPLLGRPSFRRQEVRAGGESRTLAVRRWDDEGEILILFSLAREGGSPGMALPPGSWRVVLQTEEERWGGSEGATGQALRERIPELPARSCTVIHRAAGDPS